MVASNDCSMNCAHCYSSLRYSSSMFERIRGCWALVHGTNYKDRASENLQTLRWTPSPRWLGTWALNSPQYSLAILPLEPLVLPHVLSLEGGEAEEMAEEGLALP
jgi:hypothetical protein